MSARRKVSSPWDSAIPSRSKRKGTRGHQEELADQVPADVTIIFSSDAFRWDSYLSDFLNHVCSNLVPLSSQEEPKLNIQHFRLEETPLLNMPAVQSRALSTSKATLVIISPDFLNFIETHADVYEICKLLKPSNTVAMLCGVKERCIGPMHRAALVSYDSWNRMVARDQDAEFVLSVIDAIKGILISAQENKLSHRPVFKITPRKVKEGHNKVFILLDKPLDESFKVQVFLEGEGMREVSVKRRNPFTLQFLVPESCLKISKILNVHVKCQSHSLGVLPLKVESQLGELSTILSSVDSPYELLCRTLGVESRHQVDSFLVEKFQQRLPKALRADWLLDSVAENALGNSKEELPTLLHFAACYGLKLLAQEIVECPGGQEACSLRNGRGLTPVQLANHGGHNDLSALLAQGQKKSSLRKSKSKSSSSIGDTTLRQRDPRTTPIGWAIENKTYVNIPTSEETQYDIPTSSKTLEQINIPPPRPPKLPPKPAILFQAKSRKQPDVPEPQEIFALPIECALSQPPTEHPPSPPPIEESIYLEMKGYSTPEPGSSLLPHQLLVRGQLGLLEDEHFCQDVVETLYEGMDCVILANKSLEDDSNNNDQQTTEVASTSEEIKLELPSNCTNTAEFIASTGEVMQTDPGDCSKSQEDLIAILERYKLGKDMTQIQKDFEDWKLKYNQVLDQTNLEQMQKLRKDAKPPGAPTKKKGSFGFTDFFSISKILAKYEAKKPVSKLPVEKTTTSDQEKPESTEPTAQEDEDEEEEDMSMRPISTLSSASSCNSRASTASSFSSVSVGSIYDSGNHSDSCDESANKYYKVPTGNPRSVSMHSSLAADCKSRKISYSLRPPEPPPRPNVGKSMESLLVPGLVECDYEVPINSNPVPVMQPPVWRSTESLSNLNKVVPLTHRKTSCTSIGQTSKVEENPYYLVPPPPIPIWKKGPSMFSQDACLNTQDYDVPTSKQIVLSNATGERRASESPYYSFPKSNLSIYQGSKGKERKKSVYGNL